MSQDTEDIIFHILQCLNPSTGQSYDSILDVLLCIDVHMHHEDLNDILFSLIDEEFIYKDREWYYLTELGAAKLTEYC